MVLKKILSLTRVYNFFKILFIVCVFVVVFTSYSLNGFCDTVKSPSFADGTNLLT